MFGHRKPGNALFDKTEKLNCKRQHTCQKPHQVTATFSWRGDSRKSLPAAQSAAGRSDF